MPFSALFGLVFCNLLWSGTYVATKHLMLDFHPMEVAFLRSFTGGVPLLLYCLKGGRKSELARWSRSLNQVDLRILIVGVLTFFVSPLSLMTGLSYSRAIDGALMIAMEPLFTVAAACVLLNERLRFNQVFAIALALTGAGILTELTWEKTRSFTDARLIGNVVFLASVFSEAAYSTVAKPALDRRSPVLFLTVSLWTGLVLLFTYNVVVYGPARLAGLVPLIQAADPMHWALLGYLGLGCTVFGYLYWMFVLQSVPVSIMALTLYIQPVLGLAWGHFLLGEAVTTSTYVGAALILGAVWFGSRPVSSSRVRAPHD